MVFRPDDMLQAIQRLTEAAGRAEVSSSEVADASGRSVATVRRHLDALASSGDLLREGRARATRYRLARPVRPTERPDSVTAAPVETAEDGIHPPWSDAALAVRRRLDVALGAREPVSYRREFVDGYVPNRSALMPPQLSEALYREGRSRDQLPAGTYARKVLKRLLIDLSWSSSRLEGNRYSQLATEELFKRISGGGTATDADAIMLLNHKSAIEFLVDAVPRQGLSDALVFNLHAVLMQDLLPDTHALGAIRQTVVGIGGSVYIPHQVPALLEEMLETILERARLVRNPIEAAFFLWVNLAYLQPFEDGNKRCSRLAANIPLMLYNCSPLSFIDVDVNDYAQAMLGVYEFRDVTLAVELFAWAYRRSLRQYASVKDSLVTPDPLRVRYRESLSDAMGLIVRQRQPLAAALAELGLSEATAPGFQALLQDELQKLEIFNCARYRLALPATQDWIAAGRPR